MLNVHKMRMNKVKLTVSRNQIYFFPLSLFLGLLKKADH